MKKLIAIITATLLLLFSFAGCSEGEVHTPPSLAVEDTAQEGTEANDTKASTAVAEIADESKSDGTDKPVPEDDDLEIITYAPSETGTPHNNQEASAPVNTEAVTEAQTQPREDEGEENVEETTEKDVIVLPFVPAE